MKIQLLCLKVILMSSLSLFSLFFQKVSWSQQSQQDHEHYFVGEYWVQTNNFHHTYLPTSLFDDDYEQKQDEFFLEDYSCHEPRDSLYSFSLYCSSVLSQNYLMTVVPTSTEKNMHDLYRGKYSNQFLSYPAQQFTLVLRLPWFSSDPDDADSSLFRVVSVERNSQTIEVKVEPSWISDMDVLRNYSAVQVIQIDLGYLEPGEYDIQFHRVYDGDEEEFHTDSKTLSVFDKSSSLY